MTMPDKDEDIVWPEPTSEIAPETVTDHRAPDPSDNPETNASHNDHMVVNSDKTLHPDEPSQAGISQEVSS